MTIFRTKIILICWSYLKMNKDHGFVAQRNDR